MTLLGAVIDSIGLFILQWTQNCLMAMSSDGQFWPGREEFEEGFNHLTCSAVNLWIAGIAAPPSDFPPNTATFA